MRSRLAMGVVLLALSLAFRSAVFSAEAQPAAADPLPAQTADDQGWIRLFNGKDLDGWQFDFGKAGSENRGTFSVKDGILICTGKPAGFMYTARSFGNYTFECEFAFKRPADLASDADFRGNSGCLIHIGEKNALGVWPRSIEVQGANRQLGLILPIPRSLKCVRTFDQEASDKARKPVGEFNKLEIDVRGGDMTIKLNGTIVSTVRECELTEGAIGLQSEGAETHWRNIRVRPR